MKTTSRRVDSARAARLPTPTFPEHFLMEMPDDSLSLTTTKGEKLMFQTGIDPVPGHGVLVLTGSGEYHVRKYVPGPGNTWMAETNTPGFSNFHSGRDHLLICAVMVGRMSAYVGRAAARRLGLNLAEQGGAA